MLIVFDHIVNTGLSPNEFYLIQSLYNKRIPKLDNIQMEMRKLETKGFMKENKLTTKAVEVVKEFENKYKLQTDGKIARKVKFTEEELEKVKQYREIFPKGTLPSGSPSRVTMKELEKKFMWFLLNYEYDWDTILKATRKYVAEYEAVGFKYMKTSGYFISKNEKGTVVSTLATYCDMIKEGDDEIFVNCMTHKVL